MARIKLDWEQKIDDERKAQEETAIAKAKKTFVEKFVAASEEERAGIIFDSLQEIRRAIKTLDYRTIGLVKFD